MLLEKLKNYRIILASKSPRRHMLLKGAGVNFEIITVDTDESFPNHLKAHQIPLYLSKKKAEAIDIKLSEKTLVITADTIVWLENEVINKPANRDEAIEMIGRLSGKCHVVYTGVTIKSLEKEKSFSVKSKVYFRKLRKEEIAYYVDNFKPYDKAGAYGIQDWIGYIGIKKIEGSFYNVMGLPITRLYKELEKFV